MLFDPSALKGALLAAIEVVPTPVVLGVASVVALGALVGGFEPWGNQKVKDAKWTAAGIARVKSVDPGLMEVFGKPAVGDAMTPEQQDIFANFTMFMPQLLDIGLATGTMPPHKTGFLGELFDFAFMASPVFGMVGVISLVGFSLGHFGVLTYSRAPLAVATHLFGYLYVLIHTAFVVGAHLSMAGQAKDVEKYNAMADVAKAAVPKPFPYVLWAEQAAGSEPKGAHDFDEHSWPPLVYMPPTAIPLYQKGYIFVDLPGLALLAIGSPYAYFAIWVCYLSAALSDHLFCFGGRFTDRLKTIMYLRGMNMGQYAIWVLFAHFTSPAAVSLAASLTQVAVGFAIGAPVHWAMMLAIGARPSKRPYAAKKSA